ncbi:MAG: hypothetical protein WD175_00085 [Candidatus Paceibacterota bacterium]
MTTLSLISTVLLFVSILGITGMIWRQWHEAQRLQERGRFRSLVGVLDNAVLTCLYRSGRLTHRLSRRVERGVFGYLPELLLEFTVTGCYKCYIQYMHLVVTLRGHKVRRERRMQKEASPYMRALNSKSSK